MTGGAHRARGGALRAEDVMGGASEMMEKVRQEREEKERKRRWAIAANNQLAGYAAMRKVKEAIIRIMRGQMASAIYNWKVTPPPTAL